MRLSECKDPRGQGASEGKLLDLGIAAEMLLLKDQTESDPIAFPFRLRGSRLLGTDCQSRLEIYEQLKSLYAYRCHITHSGSFRKQDDVRVPEEQLPEDFPDLSRHLSCTGPPRDCLEGEFGVAANGGDETVGQGEFWLRQASLAATVDHVARAGSHAIGHDNREANAYHIRRRLAGKVRCRSKEA